MKNTLLAARISSFLCILCIFAGFYLTLTMFGLFRQAPQDNSGVIYLLGFLGTIVGALLCPLILPSPGKWKPLLPACIFIFLVILPQFIIRSLGLQFWFGSRFSMFIMALSSGMLYPLGHGLFFLAWLKTGSENEAKSGAGRYCAFAFALVIIGAVLVRHFSADIINSSKLAANPLEAMSLLFTIIKWVLTCSGIFAVACLFMLKPNASSNAIKAPVVKTNWAFIFNLFGLAVVFNILNAAMEMRLTPYIAGSGEPFGIFFPVIAVLVPLCGYLAGFSMERFLRKFLPPAIILFILLPCLLFFENYPLFLSLISTLMSVFRFSVWVIFTAAVVENYKGSFWFYGVASLIYFSNVFSFMGPVINKLLHANTDFMILLMGTSAAVFMLLVFRILFPKQVPVKIEAAAPAAIPKSLEEIFRKHKLSEREIEIASLIINEGLNNEEIAKRIFRTAITVRTHASKIYSKFKVKGRTELMSVIMRMQNKD